MKITVIYFYSFFTEKLTKDLISQKNDFVRENFVFFYSAKLRLVFTVWKLQNFTLTRQKCRENSIRCVLETTLWKSNIEREQSFYGKRNILSSRVNFTKYFERHHVLTTFPH